MRKKEKIRLGLACLTVLITVAVLVLQKASGETMGHIWLERPENGSRSTELLLTAGEKETEFELEVGAREKTAEEKEAAFGETLRVLKETLNPEGAEKVAVTENLTLPLTVKATGAVIRWASSDEETVKQDGTVVREGLTAPCEVTLQARVTLEEECREYWFVVTVLPYQEESEEVLFYEAKEALRKLEAETVKETGFYLPDEIKGVTVGRSEAEAPVEGLLVMLVVLLPVFLWAGKRQEAEKERKERERVFLKAYPQLITKLTLYVGAGLSLRGAWERIGAEYRKRAEGTGKKDMVCEEVAMLVGELKNGRSEAGVYEAFGRRIGLKPYLRCASLLVSQLQKGSGGLREGLETEAQLAWELHREQAEKRGEEAQTKLLFPMMGLLLLVLGIVMFPAFFSMGL